MSDGGWTVPENTQYCIQCGAGYAPNRYGTPKKFCSRKCKDRFSRANQTPEQRAAHTAQATNNATQRASSGWPGFFRALLRKRHEVSANYLMEVYIRQNGRCAVSGVEMTRIRGQGRVRTNASIDRIVPGGSYTKDNVRLVCDYVNTMRSNASDDELLWWCQQIINNG